MEPGEAGGEEHTRGERQPYDTTNSGARMKKNEVKARYHKYMEEYKTTKALWDGYRGGACL